MTEPAHHTDWQCLHCQQLVEGRFDICWNCGVDTTGERDPYFQHNDDYTAEPIKAAQQFSLLGLLKLTTAIALLAAAATILHRPLPRGEVEFAELFWRTTVVIAGGVALIYLLVYAVSILLLEGARTTQTRKYPAKHQLKAHRGDPGLWS